MQSVFIITHDKYTDYEGTETETEGVFSSHEAAVEYVLTELKGRSGQKNFEPDEVGQYEIDKTSYSSETYQITEWAVDGNERGLALAIARRVKIDADPTSERRLMHFINNGVITFQEAISA